MTAPVEAGTVTASPYALAVMLAAIIVADAERHAAEPSTGYGVADAEVDPDVLAHAVAARLIEPGTAPVAVTERGRSIGQRWVANRRPLLPAMRLAVLSCPLCGDPGGYCGGWCQVYP